MPPVWSAVFHFTLTGRPDSALRLIVKDTLPPSVAVAVAPIDTTGGSSSSMIEISVFVKASVPDEPTSDNVSSRSSRLSSVGVNVKSTKADRWPAGMVIVRSPTAV